jgi:hypothetical protein
MCGEGWRGQAGTPAGRQCYMYLDAARRPLPAVFVLLIEAAVKMHGHTHLRPHLWEHLDRHRRRRHLKGLAAEAPPAALPPPPPPARGKRSSQGARTAPMDRVYPSYHARLPAVDPLQRWTYEQGAAEAEGAAAAASDGT